MKTAIMATVSSQEVPCSALSLALGVWAPQSGPAAPWPVRTCGVSERSVSRGAGKTPRSSPWNRQFPTFVSGVCSTGMRCCLCTALDAVSHSVALGSCCVRVAVLPPNPTRPSVFHREFCSPWFYIQNTFPDQALVFLTGRPSLFVLICVDTWQPS